jgi:hypothetical protein
MRTESEEFKQLDVVLVIRINVCEWKNLNIECVPPMHIQNCLCFEKKISPPSTLIHYCSSRLFRLIVFSVWNSVEIPLVISCCHSSLTTGKVVECQKADEESSWIETPTLSVDLLSAYKSLCENIVKNWGFKGNTHYYNYHYTLL